MRVVCDIEANSLGNPTKIWVVVCKNIDTGQLYIFRRISHDEKEKKRFLEFASRVELWIGHNFLEYDYPVLHSLVNLSVDNIWLKSIDTLILSRLVNFDRPGKHSLEQYGIEFGMPKIDFNDWTQYSQEMEDYCVRDVEINHLVYNKYGDITSDASWSDSIHHTQRFQLIVNDLHNNGFGFDVPNARHLLTEIVQKLEVIDKDFAEAFPPREVLIREFTPRSTKHGTIERRSVPKLLWDRLHEYEIGRTYRHTKQEPFNPSSHKQLVDVLGSSGWSPTDKTKTHVECERQLRRSPKDQALIDKLAKLRKSGWMINENNLTTLPVSAPAPARLLAKRILLEARRRSLVELLGLVQEDGRIHGKFIGIGAWTHRMAHQRPNTANIPKEFNINGTVKPYGKEFRKLWIAPKGKLLVGVDAEGIQLRIFAHLIDDPEFTKALVEGKKDDKTDPHSLNQRVLGDCCRSRDAAKRFIYALLLGAGLHKLSSILEASETSTKKALSNLIERYEGFARLRKTTIKKDATRGYFTGLDGRRIKLPGQTQSEREHLCMSGYLQAGEAIVINRAAIFIDDALHAEKKQGLWKFVNIVHDELQSEIIYDIDLAHRVAKIKCDAIKQAGIDLKLKCPLAGSYSNDGGKTFTIGKNWYLTH